MIRRLAFLLCLAGSAAHSETVFVRSGEHDSFTRLVFSIPEGRSWRMGRTDTGYGLVLDGGSDSYDFSEVFERIPRDRISNLSESNGELDIAVACACYADAFLWRPDRLVIDIIDGAAPEGSEFESDLNDAAEAVPEPDRVALPIVNPQPVVRPREPLIPGTFEVAPPSDRRVAEAERAIVESLARAASQGVFALPERPLGFVADQLQEDTAGPPSPQPPAITAVTDPMDGMPRELAEPGNRAGPGLVLRTPIERAESGEPGTESRLSHCIGNEQVSVHDWGDERDYSEQLADKRRSLTTEFDAYPVGAVEDLAKTYLYFGFGQEARQALSLDGQRTRERMILDAMSRVVDGLPVQGDIFSDQLDCDGFVVLWAALAAGSISEVSETGQNAALMAFRLLPDPLRAHLGSDLAQLFLDHGDATTADIIMTAANHLETGSSIEGALVSAAVIEEIEGPEAAIEVLGDISENSSRMTAEGLVRLIELTLAQGDPIDPSILALAATMRFEAGETDEARLLALAEISAHTFADDFETALDIALDREIPLPDMERSRATSAVFIAMADRQSESDFLAAAFGDLPEALEPPAENAVAARLIALGFPERAMDLLMGPASQEAMAERRYLRAEAALKMNDLSGVELALSGLSDPRAADIRSRAFAATGDYQSALAQDMLADDVAPDPIEAWRAGAWDLLETGGDTLLQTASRAILTESQAPAEPPTLARQRDLLDQAEATRTMTEELLGRFAVNPGDATTQ